MPGIRGRVVDLVAKLAEEPAQLVEAAVYVAGDVERPVHVAGTVPEALALEDGCLDLLDTVEDVKRRGILPSVVLASNCAAAHADCESRGCRSRGRRTISTRASRSWPPGSRRYGPTDERPAGRLFVHRRSRGECPHLPRTGRARACRAGEGATSRASSGGFLSAVRLASRVCLACGRGGGHVRSLLRLMISRHGARPCRRCGDSEGRRSPGRAGAMSIRARSGRPAVRRRPACIAG
jgi:hypothetical protein